MKIKNITADKFRFKIYIFTFIALGILFNACDENPQQFKLGEEFIDSQTQLNVIDTFSVKLSTVIYDTIVTSGTENILVGNYRDDVFGKIKSNSYTQFDHNNFTFKVHKFILLTQTKLSNLTKLPSCKIVMVEIFKFNGNEKSLSLNMLVDKILQRMFLNYLNVIIEEKLKPEIFAYRKGRNARMAVAAVYSKLNQFKYLEQVCLCFVDIEKCFDNILHDKIIKQYPFPKCYRYLLLR